MLRVYDEKTRSRVVLVGTMHYNPTSIALARDVVTEEAEAGDLRAVAVESCPTRWNATLDSQPPGSLMRWICDNEMQSAAEAGEATGATLVLADQTIEETGRRIAQLFALTFAQLLTPWAGGWSRIYDDIREAVEQTLDGGDEESVGPDALLDPRLVVGAPLSLLRYPLSLAVKAPLVGLVVLGVLFGPFFLAANDYYASVTGVDYLVGTPFAAQGDATLGEVLGALGFSFLEFVVLGRVLLVGLLEERNFVLARQIRKALFEEKPGGTLVAVLGMAHCTGVAKLLRDSRIV